MGQILPHLVGDSVKSDVETLLSVLKLVKSNLRASMKEILQKPFINKNLKLWLNNAFFFLLMFTGCILNFIYIIIFYNILYWYNYIFLKTCHYLRIWLKILFLKWNFILVFFEFHTMILLKTNYWFYYHSKIFK